MTGNNDNGNIEWRGDSSNVAVSNPEAIQKASSKGVETQPSITPRQLVDTNTGDLGQIVFEGFDPLVRKKAKESQQASKYQPFRKNCDALFEEITNIEDYLVEDVVSDEGLERIVEIEHLLEQLYDCHWGEAESLKRVVVSIQSQINNTEWTSSHVNFLKEVLSLLRVRYVIDQSTVDECYDLIEEHGLDPFRGTVSEPEIQKHYKIVEISDS